MVATIKRLRTSSQGISGTYANANHHAKDCLPLIKQIEFTLTQLGDFYDFVWEQGNNVHVIHRKDGARITFRPYVSPDQDWGIDVLAKFSRSDEMSLFAITDITEAQSACNFLTEFLDRGVEVNTYGSKEHNNNSRVEQ